MKFLRLVLLCIVLMGASVSSFAQVLTPVKVTTSTKSLGKNQFLLIVDFKINPKFHVYSQFISSDGPVPTSFVFQKSKDYELIGDVKEVGKLLQEHDPNFDMELKFFENSVSFQQKIKLKSAGTKIKCTVEYMTCDDHQCLPPKSKDYFFLVDTDEPISTDNTTLDNTSTTPAVKKDKKGHVIKTATIDSKEEEEGAAGKHKKKAATKKENHLTAIDCTAINTHVAADLPATPTAADTATKTSNASVSATGSSELSTSDPWWQILLKGMGAGLIALLMPCVFPMIPLTVSFFTKRSTTRAKGLMNALIYGLSIMALFILLGFLVGNSLNKWSSSALFNLLFFGVFVVFAVSFLGAFEITIPNSVIQRSDKASERGGILGVFFMAFTMVLISFSCTGPFIASAIQVKSASPFAAVIAMFGFGFIFALPFMFFAFFPGWLQSLPKSGSWLNSIKVAFGFIELAAAFKFLSNVDQAYHWQILPREVFLVLWIVIFALLGFYLLGKLKLNHDDELPKNDYGLPYLTVTRLLFAIITFAFTIYLIPGLWGAPLKLISGFPPPVTYTEGRWINTTGSNGSSGNTAAANALSGYHTVEGPHGLSVFHSYDEALKCAQALHKPLFVDFTGFSCVNCRKMEESVWSDDRILNHLKNDYIVVSLFVDDRAPLETEKQKLNYEGELMKTQGDFNTNLQITRYNKNAQPYYVLLDGNEQKLTEPSPANWDIEAYKTFLETGIKNYK